MENESLWLQLGKDADRHGGLVGIKLKGEKGVSGGVLCRKVKMGRRVWGDKEQMARVEGQ